MRAPILAALALLTVASLAFAQSIFSDGFESGDTSRWSNGSAPDTAYVGSRCPEFGWAIHGDYREDQGRTLRLYWHVPCLGADPLTVEVWSAVDGEPESKLSTVALRGIEIDGTPWRTATVDVGPESRRVYLPQLRQWKAVR